MNVPWWVQVSALSLLLAGCTGSTEGKGDDDDDNNPGDDDDDIVGDDDDTAESGLIPTDPLVVAAIGFEFRGIWDQDNEEIAGFLIEDETGYLGFSRPYFFVTLANLDYFQEGGNDEDANQCRFLALFDGVPSSDSGKAFDYDAGFGGTGAILETWGMFEGSLTIIPTTFDPTCTNLDTALFPTGEPLALMDGMHFGFGFGPASDYLVEQYSEGEDWVTLEPAFLSNYIAINHPDGAGGYTFDAYDWNGGLFVVTDFDVCETFLYTDTVTGFEECGLPGVDEDSYYILGVVDDQPLHGFVTSFSFWLEDTPNLDLTILKDGA